MEEYIKKSILVAEIENLENTYKKCPTRNSYEEGLKDGRLIGYKDALHKINSLEVKKVDSFIEKAVKYLKDNVTYTHPRKGTEECIVNIPKFIDYMKGE